MKPLRIFDTAARSILLAGAINSTVAGASKTSLTGRLARRSKRAVKAYYLLLGAAALYEGARALAPKTQQEKRIAKMNDLYDKAEVYGRQAGAYRRVAELFFKRRFHDLRTTLS